MANRYCVNCGEAVEGVAFCATCGTPVSGEVQPNVEAKTQVTTNNAAPPIFDNQSGFQASKSSNSGKTMQTGPLSFVEAVKSFFANYTNFEGRASQSAYWYAILFVTAANIAVSIIGSAQSGSFSNNSISFLVSLAFFLPSISVGVRRLHDVGKSGQYLWFMLIPFVGPVLLIIWFASESEKSDNEYGPRA